MTCKICGEAFYMKRGTTGGAEAEPKEQAVAPWEEEHEQEAVEYKDTQAAKE